MTRRRFVGKAAAIAAGFQIVPRCAVAGSGQTPPSERVRLAGIGAGGMGGHDIGTFAKLGMEVVALCDVDDRQAAGSFQAFPKAPRYKDFRQMLDREAPGIDAVSVGTPDHIHAIASMAAIRAGKHVYCQKPLTHTLFECRQLTRAARESGVVTSMGNQGHATEGARLTNEWIAAGIIGEVREVHAWSDRAGRLWSQGLQRPTDTPPTPAELDWNLWLGPIRERPYHPAYAPFGWRGWWDFGTGALGDMGCHILDHPIWALELGPPSVVEAQVTHDGSLLENKTWNEESFPKAAMIHFEFPERNGRPPVHLTWYDGGLMPPTPRELPAGKQLPGNGVLYVGSKGKMYHGSHGGMPQLLPESLHEVAAQVPRTLERSPGHYEEFVLGCKTGKQPVANFAYSGPMTETVLLGVLALRAPGQRIQWNAELQQCPSHPELDRYVHTEYRSGWTL